MYDKRSKRSEYRKVTRNGIGCVVVEKERKKERKLQSRKFVSLIGKSGNGERSVPRLAMQSKVNE